MLDAFTRDLLSKVSSDKLRSELTRVFDRSPSSDVIKRTHWSNRREFKKLICDGLTKELEKKLSNISCDGRWVDLDYRISIRRFPEQNQKKETRKQRLARLESGIRVNRLRRK